MGKTKGMEIFLYVFSFIVTKVILSQQYRQNVITIIFVQTLNELHLTFFLTSRIFDLILSSHMIPGKVYVVSRL